MYSARDFIVAVLARRRRLSTGTAGKYAGDSKENQCRSLESYHSSGELKTDQRNNEDGC